MPGDKVYDLIIVGGSAAATAGGIYAARRKLDFKIITKDFGGEVATSGEIGNWPGINQTDGLTLAQQFKDHLHFYKVEPEEGVEVEKITKQEDGLFCITAKTGEEVKMAAEKLPKNPSGTLQCDYLAKTVIVTTGVRPRELNIPGEKEFRNKGISYCTVCDGPIFSGQITATIGGGNSALESALMLADISPKVYVINKNPVFKGEQVLIDNLQSKKNVAIIYNVDTIGFIGEKFLTGLKYKDKAGEHELKVSGAFVHIGMVPNSKIVPDHTAKNQFGEVIVNKNCETNIPGLYAAGDVTDVPFKQIVIAAGQGTIALLSAVSYFKSIKMIYLGADHRGYDLKEKIKGWLLDWGLEYEDLGATKLDPQDDYPDYAGAVAKKVVDRNEHRGILICGSGIGVSIAANKVVGARAGTATNSKQVAAAVNDEDLNILALPADYVSENDAKEIVKSFLDAKFSQAERHIRRLNKIRQLEKSNL